MKKRKIGILGGTFNPIHIAHTSLASYFIEEVNAEKVIFVPCFVSPFKLNENIATSSQRMDMVSLAIKDNSKFEISDYEVKKEGISYTYETILHFNSIYKDSDVCLLVGGDQAENFQKWKNWKTILDNAEIFVALRKGYKIPTYEFESYKKATYLEMPFIEISASEIRENFEKGKSNENYLDKDVEQYILENNLYKN